MSRTSFALFDLPRLIAVAVLWLSATVAVAALPAGYAVKGVGDLLAEKITITNPPSSLATSRLRYESRVLAAATGVNHNGDIFGFWLQDDGQFRSHSIHLGDNPTFSMLDTENFVALSGSDASCASYLFGSICWLWGHDHAFGIRVVPPTLPEDPLTGFTALILPEDAALIPGSLPLVLNPGNFVSENAAGVIATTQVAADGQYGMIAHAGGLIVLPMVPWLVAINDLAEPMLLAYDGANGDCLVYGEGCVDDDDDWCEDDQGHWHRGHGRGHEEHGKGHGYGHERCSCDGTIVTRRMPRDGIQLGIGNDGIGTDIFITEPPAASPGALLLRLRADASLVAYRFPATAGGKAVSNLFPLAINGNRAVLRGDVDNGGTLLDKRLLSCVFDETAMDANNDAIVDCSGGMTVIGGLAGSVRAGTVLGFELSEAGRLVGNLGFGAAGTGTPFLLDVTAASPVALPLADLLAEQGNWELNTITDLATLTYVDNSTTPATTYTRDRLSGYGYRDCSAQPDAFYIDEIATAPASSLRFLRGDFESPASLPARGRLAIAPTVVGGSGSYEFRVERRTPADEAWTLHGDWAATIPDWRAGRYEGEICFRVTVRDVAAPEATRAQIVRYAVGTLAAGNGGGPETIRLNDENDAWYQLGHLGGGALPLLVLLALRRRQRPR